MGYVATVNIPGYLPMDDEPPVFESAREAWQYLADERERGEDELDAYSDTSRELGELGRELNWVAPPTGTFVTWIRSYGLDVDGTGTVYGPTPGYEGDHDLGLAYSVTWTDDDGEAE